MLDDIGRRGDGHVIARGIETCLLDDLLNCFALFCFVLSGEYQCDLYVRTVETSHERGM